jgi:hypothetical protein
MARDARNIDHAIAHPDFIGAQPLADEDGEAVAHHQHEYRVEGAQVG